MSHQKQIQEALLSGESQIAIVRALGVAASTVSYHARKLGLTTKHAPMPKRYDWVAVRKYLEGHGVLETIRHFQMTRGSWYKAKRRGDVPAKPLKYDPANVFANAKNRSSLKRALLRTGVPNRCAVVECGLNEWLGRPVSLHLDHVDGDKLNNDPSNLRFLCPNCHSQTPTYGGRNIRRKAVVL